ncbi:hypothetical protein JW826_00155 [Candidatus Woesearchaeota archaeon]|nr:hypothetical protein [Candidatus Woesearchaeota archaeon]
MIFGDYFSAMDRSYGGIEPADAPSEPEVSGEFTTSMGPQEIGTTTNPMQHQVTSFAAKIRSGTGKIELGFMGAGKSNSQQPSPEAFGKRDREDIRAMAEINEIKTSVHAALHSQSLAGLGREGFSGEARQQALKEIERAIHFASEATKGGAIVFHTGEWQRPISEIKDRTGASFLGYDDEKERAIKMIVADDRTGEVTGVRKDHRVYEPVFETVADYEKRNNVRLSGTTQRLFGENVTVNAGDWIDLNGNVIKEEWVLDEKKAEKLFDRVPKWQPDSTNFEVKPIEFKDFEEKAEKLRGLNPEKYGDITAEVLFYKTHLANQVLQAKGQSLYHAQRYDQYREERDAAKKALEFYEKLDESIPEDEKWKLMTQKQVGRYSEISQFVPPKNVSIKDHLQEQLRRLTDEMRHVHESSAYADTQAKKTLDQMNHIQTVEKYGLSKTAETIAAAGMKARDYTIAHRKELNEDIYMAPENYRPEQYGSHPDEIRDIVQKSRDKMAEDLMKRHGMNAKEASEEAKKHIKATLDVGHFNLWRQFFVAKEGESEESRGKRFENWLLSETQKLAKEGVLGHIHLTDNFGYDDEHLSPGQGNVPLKEFMKRMEAEGLKDFIAEAGSFNAETVLHDTWAALGSPAYVTRRAPTFRSVHDQHFGYHNPANYIVGAYAPSNEWKLWSEVPFE